MPVPERYSIAPVLLSDLFNAKPIVVRTTSGGPLQTGMLEVIILGEDRASMRVLLHAAPNLNQFAPVQIEEIYNVTQEMLNKVVVENGDQGFFADWSLLEERPSVANR